MPVARYFLFVGGVLLALLLAIDALVPQQAVVASQAAPSVNKTVVRIRSDQKPPERVVYDTSLPTIVPPPVVTAQATAPVVAPPSASAVVPVSADASAQARVRETFAQFVPEQAKKPEPQVQRKRKIAKSRPVAPMLAQPPQMRVAQQSHFGFFGGSNWNSTW
jgi:hypothetical protein